MMKHIGLLVAVLAMCMASFGARAEKWVDYKPGKGVWQVQVVKIDPNRIDAYITSLTKGEIPALEVLKKHGIIDDYFVMVKVNSGDYARGNVLLGRRYTSLAAMSPEVQEAPAILAEMKAAVSKQDTEKTLTGLDKYRVFDTDDLWMPVEFNAPATQRPDDAGKPKQ